jgi:hypothetical protein
VAAELERSADRARARGGLAAAAAFLERAAELSPDPAKRGARALAAASAKFDAGAPDAAQELLAAAELAPLDELQQARLERLRGAFAFHRRRRSDAPPLLLGAARRLEPLDPGWARETYLDALGAAIFAGRLDAFQPDRPRSDDSPLRRLWLGWQVANEIWEDESWEALTASAVRRARHDPLRAGQHPRKAGVAPSGGLLSVERRRVRREAPTLLAGGRACPARVRIRDGGRSLAPVQIQIEELVPRTCHAPMFGHRRVTTHHAR